METYNKESMIGELIIQGINKLSIGGINKEGEIGSYYSDEQEETIWYIILQDKIYLSWSFKKIKRLR